MDLNFNELNVRFDSTHEQLVLEVINYMSSGSPKISSIGLLRDGSHLTQIISIYERHTRWQSSHIIDLFFKYKNDVINCYQFINGWIDQYYNCGLLIVGDELRFATNRDVMVIALLVLNVLYTRRQSLNNDLKTRLEVVWIDFNSIVDSIVIWIRTRAQLIEGNGRVESFAHQLFSGHSLFEYQAIQQRLTALVQQKLIDEQTNKIEERELFIQKQTKDYSELRTKMLQIMQELSELKESNSTLVEEVKWQKGLNSELNEMVVKLKEENNVLKKLLVKENGIFKGISAAQTDDKSDKTERLETFDTLECEDNSTDDNFESSSELLLDTSIDETNSNVNDLDIDSSLSSRTGSKIEENCGLHIDCNIIALTEKPEDTDSSTETEDIRDSGNHSDAAADDILLEIYQSRSHKEHNNNNSTDLKKDDVFSFNSWQEFFANHNHDLQNGQQIDTYNENNNKSNQSFGTNDNRICINFI